MLPRVEREIEGGRSGRVVRLAAVLVLLLLLLVVGAAVPFSLGWSPDPTTRAPRMSIEPSLPMEVSSTMCSPLALRDSRMVLRTSPVDFPVRVESLSREVEEWFGRAVWLSVLPLPLAAEARRWLLVVEEERFRESWVGRGWLRVCWVREEVLRWAVERAGERPLWSLEGGKFPTTGEDADGEFTPGVLPFALSAVLVE